MEQSKGELITVGPGDVGTLTESNTNNGTIAVPMPSFLQVDETPQLANNLGSEYLGFADTRSKNWPQLQVAGVPEGGPFLFKNGQIISLPEVRYFLIVGQSFLTDMRGPDMTIHYVSDDVRETNPEPRNRQAHYVSLLLVDYQGSFIPIRADFRGTKTNAIELAFRFLEAAAQPDWVGKSEAHRVTAAFPKPFGRVFHSFITRPSQSRNSGFKFHVTQGKSVPTPVSMMERLVNAFRDEGFQEELTASHQSYLTKIAFLKEQAVKYRGK